MTPGRLPALHHALEKIIVATYALFMAGFFLIPNAVDQYKFFGFAVALPALVMIRRLWRGTGNDRLFLLILAYLLWMLVSSFWSPSFSPDEFLKAARLVAYILLFLLVCNHLATAEPQRFEQITTLVTVVAACAALASIPLWYADNPFPQSRIVGIGTLDNPNPSAFVYGFFAVLGCQLALRGPLSARSVLFGGCVLALVAFVFLTRSDTGILATLCAISILFLLREGHRLFNYTATALLFVGAATLLSQALGLSDKPVDAGLLERITLWKKVIAQIGEAPFFGHGLQRALILDAQGQPDIANYAHNALLASQRNGGLVAAVLHLAILITATVTAIRVYRHNGDPAFIAYLAFALLCMTTDTDDLITRPRELWVIFWWPLAMIIACRITFAQRACQETRRVNKRL